MTKPVKRVDLSKFTPAQRAALIDFIKTMKTAQPAATQMRQTAQILLDELIHAPQWQVLEAPRPENVIPELGQWHVGAPEISYTDERPNA